MNLGQTQNLRHSRHALTTSARVSCQIDHLKKLPTPLNEPNLKKTHLTNKKILPGEHNFHKNEKVSLRYVVNNDLKAENLNHK